MTAPVVENREKIIEEADDISNMMLAIFLGRCKMEHNNYDPGQQLYLTAHTMGCLIAKITSIIGGYGLTYAIEKLSPEKFREWVIVVSKEYEALGKKKC